MKEDMGSSSVKPTGAAKSSVEGELQALLARVRAATGPDRELDAAICAALVYGGAISSLAEGWSAYVTAEPPNRWDRCGRVYVIARHPTEGDSPFPHSSWNAAPITGSFDSALDLAEWVLPGRRIMLWQDISDDDWGAHFRSPDTDTQYAIAPALAVVAAVLDALSHQQPQPDATND